MTKEPETNGLFTNFADALDDSQFCGLGGMSGDAFMEKHRTAVREALRRCIRLSMSPKAQAEREISAENHRKMVEAEKERLRKAARPFWQRLFNKRLIIKLEDIES